MSTCTIDYDILTAKEFADRVRVSIRTAYELLRRGQVNGAAKIGGQWRIDRQRPATIGNNRQGPAQRP